MLSSSAACVRGGIRLISSASRNCVNTGPLCKRKLIRLRRKNRRAQNVRGHHVRRSLHPAKHQRKKSRQRLHRKRLRHARHAFHQRMAAAQQRQQRLLDQLLLPRNHAPNLLTPLLKQLQRRLNLLDVATGNLQFTHSNCSLQHRSPGQSEPYLLCQIPLVAVERLHQLQCTRQRRQRCVPPLPPASDVPPACPICRQVSPLPPPQ